VSPTLKNYVNEAVNKNKKKFFLLIAILLILFLFLLLDFAALHDINKEYVSKNILESLNVQLSEAIPAWTENEGEWKYLNLSILLRLLFYTVLLVLAIYSYKKENN